MGFQASRRDRHLQQRLVGETGNQPFAAIAGHEDQRHVARHQQVGQRIDRFAIQVDVQDGAVEIAAGRFALDQRDSLSQGRQLAIGPGGRWPGF